MILLFIKFNHCYKLRNYHNIDKSQQLYSTMFNKFQNKLDQVLNTDKDEIPKTDTELMVEFIDFKPWRKPKIKNLDIYYKPW